MKRANFLVVKDINSTLKLQCWTYVFHLNHKLALKTKLPFEFPTNTNLCDYGDIGDGIFIIASRDCWSNKDCNWNWFFIDHEREKDLKEEIASYLWVKFWNLYTFGPCQSNSVLFGPLLFYSVHVGPLLSIWSSSVYFNPLPFILD